MQTSQDLVNASSCLGEMDSLKLSSGFFGGLVIVYFLKERTCRANRVGEDIFGSISMKTRDTYKVVGLP